MENELITAYLTRYVLTHGIIKADGHVNHKMSPSTFTYRMDECWQFETCKDWYKDPQDALLRAEEMREAKIKSLQKQIAKLQAMAFTIPE